MQPERKTDRQGVNVTVTNEMVNSDAPCMYKELPMATITIFTLPLINWHLVGWKTAEYECS